MSVKDNNTKSEKNQYHHLTKDDRIKIEFMLNQKDENGKRLYSNSKIARELGVNKSTIGREIKNRIKSKVSVMSGKITNLPYSAYTAQEDYNFKIKDPDIAKYEDGKIIALKEGKTYKTNDVYFS